MSESDQRSIVESYIKSYNEFDIAGMISHLDENITFRNYSDGKLNLETNGIDAFKKQANAAVAYFSSRNQQISDYNENGNEIEVGIEYEAVLAQDLSETMKKGDALKLQGRSKFVFDDKKIVLIEDYS